MVELLMSGFAGGSMFYFHRRLVWWILTVSAALMSVACVKPEPVRPPNVILLSLDTLRADHLGCYGYERVTSPNIDALASRSVVFDRAIAQSSHTQPSHESLFQSRFATATSPENPVLASVLRDMGYQTVGITGGGKVAAELGFDRGFARYEEYPKGFDDSFPVIRRFLEEQATGPFFLFLHTYDIHGPYDPGPPYDGLFVEDYDGPVQASRTERLMRQILGLAPQDDYSRSISWNDADRRYFEGLYDGGIRKVDDYFGELINLLDRVDGWDWGRDIFIVFADHGEEFWDHGSVGHGMTLFQELIHVPLIIAAPHTETERVAETVMLLDVAPTIIEMAHGSLPQTFSGNSLLPILSAGDESRPSRVAISQTVNRISTVMSYPFKYIYYGNEGESYLYDLENDPEESNDLSESLKPLASELHGMLTGVGSTREVAPLVVDLQAISDEKLREQLRELGYAE